MSPSTMLVIFFFFLHDELYNVGKKRCVQEDMYTIGGKMRIRRG